jgi:hypothetical protein
VGVHEGAGMQEGVGMQEGAGWGCMKG